MTPMNTLIQTSLERPRKDLLAKPFRSSGSALILIALALACSAVSPSALAGNPHGSPTPTPTPSPSPTPVGDRGNENTAIGDGALFNLTSGVDNTAMGFQALFSNTTGSDNTAKGFGALFSNTTGRLNTATGSQALYSNTVGLANTAAGFQALLSNTTGSGNIALGFNAGSGVITASNVTAIGIAGQDVANSCYIGRIFGATSSGGTAVFVTADGKLGTATSSKRFKEDIKPMNNASEALLALKPVTFRYKKGIDPKSIPQFGLIAEDVEAVNPDLVVRDKEGKVNTVRYDAVNAMLLNEFLKEHKKVEQLKSIVAQQGEDMGVITAQLKAQAAQIHNVSAQLA